MTTPDFTFSGADHGRADRTATGWTVTAGPMTDLFTPPDGGAPVDRLPRLTWHSGPLSRAAPVALSARVRPQLGATFDAGTLLVATAAGDWGKLAFERSPQGLGTLVSVVKRGTSDDSNGRAVAGKAVFLRIYCDGRVVAFHASDDGTVWEMIRLFALPGVADGVALSLSAQSPTGPGCTADFDRVTLSRTPLRDLRDGS
jgi:regulation of enolase protein 1 (concanavalin A-like superfamily)